MKSRASSHFLILVLIVALTAIARLDNLAGKEYFGSVIVNDANQRYFEPAPTRSWLLGAQLAYTFR